MRVCLLIGMACLLGLAGCGGIDIEDTENFCPALLLAAAFNPVRETWECYERVRRPPLVTLTRLGGEGEGVGVVCVGSEPQVAAFRIAGFDRRWNFGCDEEEGRCSFAFLIEPNGRGLYYNFSASKNGTAGPRNFYDCELAS